MRICLITPPSGFLMDERVFPNLGILKVASSLLSRPEYVVNKIDCSGVANYPEVVRDYCLNNSPDAFGITVTTPQLPAVMKVVKVIRDCKPNTKIVLGGPHVTLVNAARKKEVAKSKVGRATRAFWDLSRSIDVLVAGDGEEAIFAALKPNSPSLIDADNPKDSLLWLTNQRLEELPFPARQLLDLSSYHYTIDGIPATSLIAQLGCPYPCGFCGGRESQAFRRVRTRSSDHVVAEMVYLYENYGYRAFMLYDDELNVNPNMLELMRKIREAQESLGIEFRLRGFIKANLFTDEQAKAMYEAGFRWILVGFESGAPRILTNINKRSTLDENTRCLEIAKKHGLKVKALMSLGHPGESAETIQQTEDWLMQARPDDFDATIITEFPGTPYYDHSEPVPGEPGTWVYTYDRTGDKLFSQEIDYGEVENYYKGNPFDADGYQAYVWTDSLSREDLVAHRNDLEFRLRHSLGIPFPSSHAAQRYEHSMGQMELPSHILRSAEARVA